MLKAKGGCHFPKWQEMAVEMFVKIQGVWKYEVTPSIELRTKKGYVYYSSATMMFLSSI